MSCGRPCSQGSWSASPAWCGHAIGSARRRRPRASEGRLLNGMYWRGGAVTALLFVRQRVVETLQAVPPAVADSGEPAAHRQSQQPRPGHEGTQ